MAPTNSDVRLPPCAFRKDSALPRFLNIGAPLQTKVNEELKKRFEYYAIPAVGVDFRYELDVSRLD
jgi:hypothetical protein